MSPTVPTARLSPHGPLGPPHPACSAQLGRRGLCRCGSLHLPCPPSQSRVATKCGSGSFCTVVALTHTCVCMGLGSPKGDVDLGQGFSEGMGHGDPVPRQPAPPPPR